MKYMLRNRETLKNLPLCRKTTSLIRGKKHGIAATMLERKTIRNI